MLQVIVQVPQTSASELEAARQTKHAAVALSGINPTAATGGGAGKTGAAPQQVRSPLLVVPQFSAIF